MGNYKPTANKKSIGIIVITVIFAIIGVVCIIAAYGNEFLIWLRTIGVVLVVLTAPALVTLIYLFLIKKIKEY